MIGRNFAYLIILIYMYIGRYLLTHKLSGETSSSKPGRSSNDVVERLAGVGTVSIVRY